MGADSCNSCLPPIDNRKSNQLASVVVSVAMLAAAHAFATLEVAPARNLQAAEAQAQETVKLSISGMVWKVNCVKKSAART